MLRPSTFAEVLRAFVEAVSPLAAKPPFSEGVVRVLMVFLFVFCPYLDFVKLPVEIGHQ